VRERAFQFVPASHAILLQARKRIPPQVADIPMRYSAERSPPQDVPFC